MSASPDAKSRTDVSLWTGLSPVQYAALATAFAVLGVSAIWFPMRSLWDMWTSDALKSIGMVVPLASLVLILRVWRTLGWNSDGSWWGLPLLLLAVALARFQAQTVVIMIISPSWSTTLPPPQLSLLAYGAGTVLLLGGRRLFRAAFFPIALLWFANPVPHIFSLTVDLPLQESSAHIARSFAMKLGHPLTRDHLRLMFTPDFGMFIAPGCNGIRGSVTMGLIALVAGYVYRFRWHASALVAVGGVLLGYAFNLARLCLLVVYYGIALHFPSLQNKAENADYVIGAALFLLAAFLLSAIVQRLRGTNHAAVEKSAPQDLAEPPDHQLPRQSVRFAAMVSIALFGFTSMAGANTAFPASPAVVAVEAEAGFPTHLGSYRLVRSWNETFVTGSIIYVWAEYESSNGGVPIAIGISPVLGPHDTLVCHLSRGQMPRWQGQLTITTAGSVPVSFNSAFYNDGVTQSLEASTICNRDICGESSTAKVRFGFLYSHPDIKTLVAERGQRPIPVLIRVETTDMTAAPGVAQHLLVEDLKAFLASVKISDLIDPYCPLR